MIDKIGASYNINDQNNNNIINGNIIIDNEMMIGIAVLYVLQVYVVNKLKVYQRMVKQMFDNNINSPNNSNKSVHIIGGGGTNSAVNSPSNNKDNTKNRLQLYQSVSVDTGSEANSMSLVRKR